MGVNLLKKIGVAALGAAIMTLTIACSKSGSGTVAGGGGDPFANQWGHSQGYGFGSQGCTNCGSATQYIVTALGQGGQGFLQLGLDVFFDPRGIYSPDGTLMSVFQNYQGPIAATGVLEVANDYSTCQVHPGLYKLTTVQPGQFLGMSQFRGLILQGVNTQTGMPIVISVNAASNNYLTYLTNPGYSWGGVPYHFRIQKTMTIVSVGNYACQNGVYELY